QGQLRGGGVVDQLLGDEVDLAGVRVGEQVAVLLLHALVGGAAAGAGDGPGALDPPGGVVAGPQQPDGAALGQLGQGVDGLLLRGGPVVDVGVVQVQPGAAQLAPARSAGP